MDAELEQFNTLWADKPNRELAKEFATEYCAAHDAELRPLFGALERDALVVLVDYYRARDDETTRTKLDIWLLANHPPQVIGGAVNYGG